MKKNCEKSNCGVFWALNYSEKLNMWIVVENNKDRIEIKIELKYAVNQNGTKNFYIRSLKYWENEIEYFSI